LEAPDTKVLTWLQFSLDDSKLAAGTTSDSIQIWDLAAIREQLASLSLDWDSPALPSTRKAPLPLSVKALAIPNADRDPQCTVNQIDLTPSYTAALADAWLGSPGPAPDNTLASLPRGMQTFAGVDFDIRGIVQVGGTQNELAKGYPTAVADIRINRRCQALHFLQATVFATTNGVAVGEYIIHYADGHKVKVPLIGGDNISDWWHTPPHPLSLNSNTCVAWQGSNPDAARAATVIQLYKFRWTNARPETEIASIDFQSLLTPVAPFLIAITAE